MKQPILPLGGINACYEEDAKGSVFYAEIEPSGGRWYRQVLPNVKRWWFEVNEIEKEPTDELGIGVVSHAYTDYGSGGAWTLRGCIIKARRAIEKAVEVSNCADDVIKEADDADHNKKSK